MRTLRAIFILAALAAIASSPQKASARGALGYDQDQCVIKIGPDFLYFSGYQLNLNAEHRKFCEDAPGVGDTTFVFDYGQEELRQMKADFRILRDNGPSGGDQGVDGPSLAYLPPAVYPKGTFSFVYRFDDPGNYIGVVTMDGPEGEHWVARFPFSVGGAGPSKTPYVLLALAAAMALGLFFFGGEKKRTAR
ncbi:MAG TPA: hypothetical protein VEH76_06145 [Methylocystis sp.]|nr:hypothetical protein [Methylocystis sp.]